MAYISQYSGEELDAGIAAIQDNQMNIDTINNNIDTINNNIDTKLDKQNIVISTTDLIDGESTLNTGCLYFVYDEE